MLALRSRNKSVLALRSRNKSVLALLSLPEGNTTIAPGFNPENVVPTTHNRGCVLVVYGKPRVRISKMVV